MKLGFIGLGRMGLGMVTRLLKNHQVVAYDLSKPRIDEAVQKGAEASTSPGDLVARLKAPRVIWLMVPAGKPVEELVQTLEPLLSEGDVLIDGGNSFYKDSVRRAKKLAKRKVDYVDVGTSGGLEGIDTGLCLMVGGNANAFRIVEPVLRDLAAPEGYSHVGPSGAGHFVKMVHNGVEYAILQALGEGFEVLSRGPYEVNLSRVSRLWTKGSVIRSWLLSLAAELFETQPELEDVAAQVGGGETGRWMVEDAMAREVSTPVISTALQMRFASRSRDSLSARFVAAMRGEFGGHEVPRK